jgi:hypothetical protein
VVARTLVRPGAGVSVVVPLRPGPDGRCTVLFTVAPTAVPALVDPASTDTRRLGLHFERFSYRVP